MIHRGSNLDVYVTWRDEFRGSQGLQTSQNHELVLDVCSSVPATDMRQNQPQVDGRTHTTNTPHQGTPGQHWMSARAMSAHFFTSLHPCLTQSGTYDGVESRGWSDTHSHCSAQFTSLITPNIIYSIYRSKVERPGARSPYRWSHTGRCDDGQPQTAPTRFDTRVSLRQVFHLHQNYG